jgi:hypothetical protein
VDDRPILLPKLHRHCVRRCKFAYAAPDALRIGDEPEREEVDQRLVVDAPLEPRPVEQPLQLGGEDEGAVDQRVVEGLLARPVARAEQALLPRIPQREGEHAREPIERVGAPAPVGFEQHLGVRLGSKPDAVGFEAAAHRAVVVDLAVEGDDQPAVVGAHRLAGAGVEIDDGKAPVAEADPAIGRTPQAGVIRAAVRQPVAHALHRGTIDTRSRQHADDAAHQVGQRFTRRAPADA